MRISLVIELVVPDIEGIRGDAVRGCMQAFNEIGITVDLWKGEPARSLSVSLSVSLSNGRIGRGSVDSDSDSDSDSDYKQWRYMSARGVHCGP